MYINLFEEIKKLLNIKEVVLYYGLKLTQNDMACCPFHSDKTPSLKINKENYFYCFGCGVKGDVITFVEKMFSLSPIDAAKKLDNDFDLNLNKNRTQVKIIKKVEIKEEKINDDFQQWEIYAYNILTDYFKLLNRWKIEFAPIHENDVYNLQFIEAVQACDKINYYCEILRLGNLEEKMLFFLDIEKEVDRIEQRIERYKQRNAG